ncbi:MULTISPECIES: Mov34/MPN/PAD-1 family protein [Sphingobacterium]|uniref:Mov34/MPN/PAD-1 family protein n=1 Tax=Sphingobacterium TaxID=28453 RepID=UPI00257BABA0|nr:MULTISPECIES: Mov34/MPN/PAD-1 family protein [Sphingobacterium]
MKLNTTNGLSLEISESLIVELSEIGQKHFPHEFGGFLLGRYSSDFKTLFVVEYLLPIRYKGQPYSFERSTDGLIETFNQLFSERNIYYVGEWHTHPNGSAQFSSTDLNAMIEAANCTTVSITNPVLLILSLSKLKLNDFEIYLLKNNTLINYEKS